jgi:uncharacterized membrane protein YqhA
MRILIIGLVIGMFMAAPLFLYQAFVQPSLTSLLQTYTNAGTYADRVAEGM